MYLNLVQVAESFGVAEKVVEDWIRNEGLPHTSDRGRLLFDRAQVANWAAARGLAAHVGFLAPEVLHVTNSWRIGVLLRAGGIWRDVVPAAVPEIFRQVATSLPGATPAIRQLLVQRLQAPSGVAFAPIGGGFALPHPSSRISLGRESGVVALLCLREGIALSEPVPDGVPVIRLLFFIAPSPRAHLDLLGRMARILKKPAVRDLLLRAAANEEIFRAIEDAEAAEPRNGTLEGKP
jgi:PTS system nitrogen regulatory IIA component